MWPVLLSLWAWNDVSLEEARDHLARGRYAEAIDAFEELGKASPREPAVIRGWSRALWSNGDRIAAAKVLDEAFTAGVNTADLYAESARQQFERGRWTEAEASVQIALKLQSDEPLARLIHAHLLTERGDLKAAADAYRWFVRFYNRSQPTDAETLVLVARGSAQYARWQGVSQIFDFTINTLCVDALKDDKTCWEARAVAGALLLEKYNEAEGKPELDAALAINPRAVEVQLAIADAALKDLAYAQAEKAIDRALAVDPQHPQALRASAEAAAMYGRIEGAEQRLAAALAANPFDQRTLALQVFVSAMNGTAPSPERFGTLLAHLDKIAEWQPNESPVEAVIVGLAKRNPRPGYFLYELGRLFETQRKFALAEKCYQQAMVSMPQLSAPKTELGRLLFQTGRIDEARKLLDAAFKADPYHIRVSNLRKVMRVLDDYATTATPHFVIRSDAQLDGILAKYMAEYLEEIYPDITGQFGYEPAQRTQIEIYNKAKGLAGHQWFSARMIGLPWIQTIGASTGMIVALTSPTATEEPFNWARVLRHEFVHIVTLQQTDFNIPHWYTEALATRAEGYPSPQEWNRLLRVRVAKNQLRTLDNLHLGFQRAESADDWSFAYCQSVLYADYFVERFGDGALARLLEAYRHTRSTSAAVQEAFQVALPDLEAGYRRFLDVRVRRLTDIDSLPDIDPATVRKSYEARPQDPEATAAIAEFQLRRGMFAEAASLADKVLKDHPRHLRATLVSARCALQEKNLDAAAKTLAAAWLPDTPQPQLAALLGEVYLRKKDPQPARDVFLAAQRAFPDDPQWWRGLASAAKLANDRPQRLNALERLSQLDPDSASARQELAQAALDDADAPRAAQFAKRALQVDVLDANTHRILARSFLRQDQWKAAVAEFEIATQLQPGQPDAEVELAEALHRAGRSNEARQRVQAVLKKHPDHAAAKRLSDAIPP